MTSAKLAPPNSVVLLVGSKRSVDVPPSLGGALVAASSSCIAIGCLAEIDGETEFWLGQKRDLNSQQTSLFFSGSLETPDLRVIIETVTGDKILEATVPKQETFVEVWANKKVEPDQVSIAIL